MKFSEIPKFLLNEFLSINLPAPPPPSGSHLFMGGMGGLVLSTDVGSYFELVIETIKDDNPQYYFIPFFAYSPVFANDFFYVERATNLETAATSAIVIQEECNAYLKKSSTYDEYRYDIDTGARYKAVLFDRMVRYRSVEDRTYLDYVNVQKPFLYIGKIYQDFDPSNVYRIEYWGMDRYALSCLPPHLQTPRIKSFFEIYFDQVYNRVYNKERCVITLLDALEVDLNFISYLSETFREPISKEYLDSLSNDFYSTATRKMERRLRENVRELPNFLKRKGSYASMYGIFQNFFWATADSIAIYERWHTKDICNGWPQDPTAVPHSPIGHFIDLNYLNYYENYDNTLTQCVSAGHDTLISAGGYPVPLSNCFIHQEKHPLHLWFIVHALHSIAPIVQVYDNEFNLVSPKRIFSTTEDITLIEFDTEQAGTALLVKPEAIDTISPAPLHWDFRHNVNSVAPIVYGGIPSTFTYNTFTIPVTASLSFDNVLPLGVNDVTITNTTTVGGTVISTAVNEDYIFTQTSPSATWNIEHPLDSLAIIANIYVTEASDTWNIAHSLGTSAIVVQPYTTDNELIQNCTIEILSDSGLIIRLDQALNGKVHIAVADESLPLSAASTWELDRAFGGYALNSQVFNSDHLDVKTSDLDEISTNYNHTSLTSLDGPMSGIFNYKVPSYVETKMDKEEIWTITHELSAIGVVTDLYVSVSASDFVITNPISAADAIVQCYNSDREMITPDIPLVVTSESISAHFNTPTEAYFVFGPATQTDLIWASVQDTPSDLWWIEHYLDNFQTLIFIYDDNGDVLVPDSVQQYSKDWYKITFSTPQTGRVVIRVVDDLVIYTKKAAPQSIIINDIDNVTATFNTPRMGYAACSVSDVIAKEVFRYYPTAFKVLDNDNCQAIFPSPMAGLASLKEVGKLTYAEGLIESPHYKIEIDVNCEPLCYPNIIEQNIALQMISKWETARPACKYAHYSIFIAPKSDFSQNKIDMYENRFVDTKVYTFCTVDTEVAVPGEMYRYAQYNTTNHWVIYHDLDTYDLIVQCYDIDLNLIYPARVELRTANIAEIFWAEPQGGYAFLMKGNYAYTDTVATTATGEWMMSMASCGASATSDYYFYKERGQLVPINVELSTDSVSASWYTPTLGYGNVRNISANTYVHIQSVEATTWTINHDLAHLGVIIQCFDTNNNMMVPDHIQLDKYDKICTVTFTNPTNGYAVIRAVGGIYDVNAIIESIAAGGYMKVGGVAGVDKWNAEDRMDVKDATPFITTQPLVVSEDAGHYYIAGKIEDEYQDKSVTEIGLFTSEDELVFYTYVRPPSQLYKTMETDLSILFRLAKEYY